MTAEGIVFVHGGYHTGACWDQVLPLLDLPAVTVDLPGRGARPADPGSVTLDDCVAAVLDDVELAGWERFALVGHSMGGLTITETAFRHPDRVTHLVYVAAVVPAPGQTIEQVMVPGGEVTSVDGAVLPLPDELARALFGNDFDDEQWARWARDLVPEALGLFRTPLSGHPSGIPVTYVGMTQDQPVPPALAAQMAANAGATDVRSIDAGHSVMGSKPAELAAILNEVLAG